MLSYNFNQLLKLTNSYNKNDTITEETMLLKAVAPGSLANDNVNGMGEFMVQVTLDDSTVAYVEKFYNNTVHYVDNAGNTGTIPYTLGQDPSGDFELESGKGVVDIVSE